MAASQPKRGEKKYFKLNINPRAKYNHHPLVALDRKNLLPDYSNFEQILSTNLNGKINDPDNDLSNSYIHSVMDDFNKRSEEHTSELQSH